MSALRLVPVDRKTARAFVAAWHRHNRPPPVSIFNVGVANADDELVAVAMVGRPAARLFSDGQTLEVNRVATDDTPHAASMLYGAAWRAAKALGYTRLITYTRADEPGTSLRAAGWRVVAERPARPGWNTISRPRHGAYDSIPRTLWEADA